MARANTFQIIFSESRARARRSPWLITVPAALSPTGKRQQKAYSTERAARDALRTLRAAHQRLGEAVKDCTLDLEAQATWKRCLAMAEKAETTPTAAISFAVECIEAFGSLDEARRLARWAKQNALRAWPDVTVLEALDEHIAEATHLSPTSLQQRKTIRARLCREALDFVGNYYMHELTVQLVQAEFARLAWPPQSENTALRVLKALCSWAQRKGYIDPNVDPLKRLPLQRVEEKEITALQPSQLASLLRTAMQTPRFTQCGLAVALGAFAGIRPTECRRLRWHDISEEDGVISVRSKAAKTGGTRHVILRPVLRAWLDYFAPPEKRVPDALVLTHYPLGTVTIFHAAAGLREWPADVLRHSFASYSIKGGTPMHDVQADMGHATLQLLRARYLNMRGLTAAGAREWWNMTPTRVVSFHGNPGLP
jgi:integrase